VNSLAKGEKESKGGESHCFCKQDLGKGGGRVLMGEKTVVTARQELPGNSALEKKRSLEGEGEFEISCTPRRKAPGEDESV